MTAEAFSQLVVLYGWFLLVMLLVFLMLIARFYQRLSGDQTYFRLFLIPVVLFGIQTVRQTNFPHDPINDLLAGTGGIILISLCLMLYRKMTTGRGSA